MSQHTEPDLTTLLSIVADPVGPLASRMGMTIIEASPRRVVATLPVEGNTQPYGILNGGASAVLAEVIGSAGSALHGYPDRLPVGIELNATHHRPVSEGIVTGVGTAIHLGRTMATWEIVVSDSRDRRVCTARLSCAMVPAERFGVAPPPSHRP